MKNIFLALPIIAAAVACAPRQNDDADARQTAAQKQALNAADREIGMPRIVNFAQRKMLKNSYEDMDQTTLTYVYVQSIDGKFVCLGQGVGYGVMGGTQFTAPTSISWVNEHVGYQERPQAEPNGLFMPSNGAATIVNLVNPENGEAHTALIEPNVVTLPFKLPPSVVNVPCPGDVDPARVHDAKETSIVRQR